MHACSSTYFYEPTTFTLGKLIFQALVLIFKGVTLLDLGKLFWLALVCVLAFFHLLKKILRNHRGLVRNLRFTAIFGLRIV